MVCYGDLKSDPYRAKAPAKLIIAKGHSEGVGEVLVWFHPKRTEYTEAIDDSEWHAAVREVSAPAKGES